MKWNEEEIRAAIEKVAVKYSPHIESSVPQLIADGALAELAKPAIHPSVPVMYDFNGTPRTSFADCYFHEDVTNIRPLVPVEVVQKWVRAWHYDSDDKTVEVYIADKMAHYLATGETE